MLRHSTISKLVRRNGIGCVSYGMRSSFRDLPAECSDSPRSENSHWHTSTATAFKAVHRCSNLFENRRDYMNDRADS